MLKKIAKDGVHSAPDGLGVISRSPRRRRHRSRSETPCSWNRNVKSARASFFARDGSFAQESGPRMSMRTWLNATSPLNVSNPRELNQHSPTAAPMSTKSYLACLGSR